MKVKVKRIKRSSVSDVKLTKSKLKVKAREFFDFLKSELPESEAVTVMLNLKSKNIHYFVHKDNAIDESFDFGGKIWNG